MRIVVLDGEVANPGDLHWDDFAALGELCVYADTPPDAVIQRIGDAGAAINNRVHIGAEVMDACKSLRYIGLLSTGYNTVDVQAAAQRGIVVCNVPNYSTEGVAQATIALLLEITNRVGAHDARVHAGEWETTTDWGSWTKPLFLLAGKTFGAIGFGSIGRATARIARAMGMRVLATGSRKTPEGTALAEYVTLDALLAGSDVVSLHCPLLPETRGLINRQTLSKMKPGAILLNTARGGLLDEAAVAEALESGGLRAAGLDVAAREPITGDNPLLRAPNCFITPHIAWGDRDTREKLLQIAAGNLRAFLDGAPVNVIKPQEGTYV